MKEAELREAVTCAHCRRKIGQTGLPIFYRVSIERHGVDIHAVNRQAGLEQMLGGTAFLAHTMGPDENMTVVLMDRQTITICDECAAKDIMVHQLAEYANDQKEEVPA